MLSVKNNNELKKMIFEFIRERLKTKKIVSSDDVAKKFGISKEDAIEIMK